MVALCSDDIDDCYVSDSVFAVTVVSNCLVVAPAANRGMLPVSPYYSVRKFFDRCCILLGMGCQNNKPIRMTSLDYSASHCGTLSFLLIY